MKGLKALYASKACASFCITLYENRVISLARGRQSEPLQPPRQWKCSFTNLLFKLDANCIGESSLHMNLQKMFGISFRVFLQTILSPLANDSPASTGALNYCTKQIVLCYHLERKQYYVRRQISPDSTRVYPTLGLNKRFLVIKQSSVPAFFRTTGPDPAGQ